MTSARSTRLAAGVTVLLLMPALAYLAYAFLNRHDISPGDFGSLLAGIFSPLALLWIIFTAHLQYRALQHQSVESDHSRAILRRTRLIDIANKCSDPRGLRAIRALLDRQMNTMPGNWPVNINKLHDDPEIHASAIQHLDALELASVAILGQTVDEDEARTLLERNLISAFGAIQYAMKDWRTGPMKGVACYHNLQTLSRRWTILNTGHGDVPPLEPILTRAQRLGLPDPVARPTDLA